MRVSSLFYMLIVMCGPVDQRPCDALPGSGVCDVLEIHGFDFDIRQNNVISL